MQAASSWPNVTLAAYVKAVKMAKAHPDAEFKHTLCNWWPGTGKEIMAEDNGDRNFLPEAGVF